MALTAKQLDKVRSNVPVAAAAQDEIVRVNLNVSQTMRDHWKMLAIKHRVSLGALIESAMNEKYPKE